MKLIPLILFVLACNFDNFIIGISYGIKNIKVTAESIFIIALPTFLGTYLSLAMGNKVFELLPNNSSNIISSVLLIGIGLYSLIKNYIKKETINNAEVAQSYDKDKNGNIDAKEAILLGLFLALNNVCIAIGFSTNSYNKMLVSIITSILSAIGFNVGNSLGKKFKPRSFDYYGNTVSALLIIILGILEMFF